MNILKSHEQTSHIADNSIMCRFRCGKGFNGSSNRNKHERQIHKMLYTQFVKLQKGELIVQQQQHHHQQQQQQQLEPVNLNMMHA